MTAAAFVILTTSTWAAFSNREAFGEESEDALEAPIPPPEEVYIQQRENVDDLGNVYILVQLSEAQVAAKRVEGTADYLTLGTPENLVILRDDGDGGDTGAEDRIYTGIGSVDVEALQRRASQDQQALNDHPRQLVPVFEGRTAVDVARPVGFDYAGFAAGEVVRFGPAVVFLGPERMKSETESRVAPIRSSKGPRSVTSQITFANPVVPGTSTFQDRVLMITDPSVVGDLNRTWNPCTGQGNPSGVWTFNHLMTQMSNQGLTGIPPSLFVENWLQTWLDPNLVINGDHVPDRTRMSHIISQWPKVPGTNQLDLSKSPLQLLAITPRIDLREGTGGGGGYSTSPVSGNFLHAGEVRLTFGFVAKKIPLVFDPEQVFSTPTGESLAAQINSTDCYALPFTVIFEYRIVKTGCQDVKSWAQQWSNLNTWTPGSSTYNSNLESLTQQFVVANANPNGGNGSALGQLRTNEIALEVPWELREFRLGSGQGFLEPNEVADTMQIEFNKDSNGTGMLHQWILSIKGVLATNGNEAKIPLVPFLIQDLTPPPPPNTPPVTHNFLAGHAQVPENDPNYTTFHWNAPDPNVNVLTDLQENWARHRVSRATCSGCHSSETFTNFVHINSANTIVTQSWSGNDWSSIPPARALPSLPAELSRFLTGVNGLGDRGYVAANGTWDDRHPFIGQPKRNFDDLARRELDITAMANSTCMQFPAVDTASVLQSVKATGKLPSNLFERAPIERRRVPVAVNDMKRNPIFEVH